MMRFGRRFRDYSVIVILAFLLCLGLLTTSGPYPSGWDSLSLYGYLGFYLGHSSTSWTWVRYSSWSPVFAYGEVGGAVSLFSLLELLFVGLLGVSGLKVFVVSLVVLAGVSIYELSYRYARSSVAGMFAAVVYLFNRNFFFSLFGGGYSIVFGIALFPFVFKVIDEALERKKSGNVILASLFLALFVGSAHSIPLFMFGLLLAAYLTYQLLIVAYRSGLSRSLLRYGVVIVSIVTLSVLFSLPFIASMLWNISPQLAGSTVSGRSLSSFSIQDNSSSLFDALMQKGGASETYWEFSPSYNWVYVLVPVTAFLCLMFRRDRFTVFFSGCAVVSIFLAKGVSPPIPEVYQWLYVHVPYFYGAAHRPAFWLMVTAFAYAVLAGMSIESIYDRLGAWSRNGLPSAGTRRCPRKALRRGTTGLVLIAILVVSFSNPFLGLSYRFTAFSLPRSYLDAYGWLADRSDDGVILAVPFDAPYGTYSFASTFAVKNLGQLIPAYTGKSAVAATAQTRIGGYYDFLAFVDRTIRENRTSELMETLGTFNIRYVVILPNAPDSYNEFFLKQNGLRQVYRNEEISIFQNEYWNPVLFPASRDAVVVGGYDVFNLMTRFDSFRLNEWALFFANSAEKTELSAMIDRTQAVIFANAEPLDFAVPLLTDSVRAKAADYSGGFTNPLHDWIATSDWVRQGELVLNNQLLYTRGNASVSIPVNVGRNELYDVYARVLCGPHAGHLSFEIDQTHLGGITPYTRGYSGLKWTAVGSVTVSEGKHLLTIETNGGESGIDEIALVVPESLRNITKMLEDALQDKVVVQILEGREMSKWASTQQYGDWWTFPKELDTSNGYVANLTSSAGSGRSWIPLNITIMREGWYGLALRALTGRSSGNLGLRIDNGSIQSLNLYRPSEERFQWVIPNEQIRLKDGVHTFEFSAVGGKVEVDQFVLYSGKKGQTGMSLDDLLGSQETGEATVSYRIVNPTEYMVHIKTNAPVFLVFSQAYNSEWKAYVGGDYFSPRLVYSMFNGFYLNRTGEFNVELRYAAQQMFEYLWAASTLLVLVVPAVYLLRRRSRFLDVPDPSLGSYVGAMQHRDLYFVQHGDVMGNPANDKAQGSRETII